MIHTMTRESVILPDLWKKLGDHPDRKASELLQELQSTRKRILTSTIEQPAKLATWLYENQGDRRFDASNRMFLILVNESRYFDSWELKRAKSLIAESVNSYLDKSENGGGFKINFTYEGNKYRAEADMIFVISN